jgi:lipopolysaccharide export system protein LptA
MQYLKTFYFLLLSGLLFNPVLSFAQVPEQAPKTTTTTAEDTLVTVEILGARKLEFRKLDDSTQIQILAGDVKLKQGTTLFYSDSCIINNSNNIFEAWGHVHINDSDTTNVYSSHLRYLIDKKTSFLDGGVTLTDGKGTLTTPDLEYDVNTKIGIYKHGGKVTTKKTVLTSREGYYYADLKDVYFKNKVELNDPAYNIISDSLLYNTESQTTRFIAETFIKDSSGRTIETKDGSYNMQTGKAEFGLRPIVHDKGTFATGNQMMIDDSTGIVQMRGNSLVIDSINNTTILAGEIYLNRKTNAFLAIKKPLMIVKQENDSIYITADTLFSARLTDLTKRVPVITNTDVTKENKSIVTNRTGNVSTNRSDSIGMKENKISNINRKDTPNITVKDSIGISRSDSAIINRNDSIDIKGEDISKINNRNIPSIEKRDSINIFRRDSTSLNRKDSISINKQDSVVKKTVTESEAVTINEKDSTNRYFEAYRNVRIFSDSMQAVCDSLFYSFKDSVFRLYDDPVLWSKDNQITGDTILLLTKNKKADRIKIFNNSFLVNKLDPEVYNQIKSSRMDGYFNNGSMDSLHASGLAECIYYIQDEDSAYTGINESKSDILDIYFAQQKLNKVVFRSAVEGTIWPMRQKTPEEMRLKNFKWLEARRPKTKFELFE